MKKTNQDEYSIKVLSYSNWLEIDETNKILIKQSTGKEPTSFSESEWFERINNIKVNDSVPSEIHYLIEVARSTMTYGYFYYPIFTFAFEQFFRITETAVVKKCSLLLAPKNKFSFKQKIKWLYNQGIISKSSYDVWGNIVQLRNIVSHPKRLNIVSPNIMIKTIDSLIILINDLFNDQGKRKGKTAKGYILTYENIPFSGFSQNGSKVLFNEEPYIFSRLPIATRMRTKLKIVIKDSNDVEGLESIKSPIDLEIKKLFE